MVTISDPAMGSHEVDLDELLGCARRELALRERVYPKWVAKGSMTQTKADRELEGMRGIVEFLVHCIFKAVTRSARPSAGGDDARGV